MDVVTLKGTYEEIGVQHGLLLKGSLNAFPASDAKKEFARKCEATTREHCPGLVDEIEGLSSSAELDPDLMKCFILTLGLEPGCSVLALSGEHTVDGVPVLARNYDWDVTFKEYFTPFRVELTGGLTSISFTDHMVGRYGGANEAGLAAAITAIPAYRGRPTPGIRMNIATRWILDHHRTTEEAAEWLAETPHQWAHNFLLADSKGTLARVETAPERTRIQYSEDFIATTNHYHDEEMKGLEDPEFDFSNTHRRYGNMERWHEGNGDKIGLDEIRRMLSDHETGVCDHYEHQGVRGGTIWSWIAPLGERRAHVCHGPPCSNDYKIIDY
jgi:predicted choloylglycine hydrolase